MQLQLFSIIFLALSASSYSQTVFRATLSGDQVISGTPSISASAIANFELSSDQSSLTYDIQLDGIDLDENASPDELDSIHIYAGSPGSTGILVFIIYSDSNASDDLQATTDDGLDQLTGDWDNGDTVPLSSQLSNLKSGNLYLKVYSSVQGDIRGQIVDISPIPTLSEWGLIILGIGLIIFGVVALRIFSHRPELSTN